MVVQALGTIGTGSQTHLLPARLHTKVTAFWDPNKWHPWTKRRKALAPRRLETAYCVDHELQRPFPTRINTLRPRAFPDY